MIRFISLVVAGFLFLTTLEAWAWVWVAGRWYMSSRYANLTLATVKSWRDRGIINRSTKWVKTFINKNGKWILLTLAVGSLLQELDDLESSSQYCYVDSGSIRLAWLDYGRLVVRHAGNNPQDFYNVSSSSTCYSGSANVPAIQIYKRVPYRDSYTWTDWAWVPKAGTYTVGQCQVTVTNRNIGSVCNFSQAPSLPNLDQERRDVPVRLYPNPADFIRPDVIESDPTLRYLRDEYQRISRDLNIPDVSQHIGGVSLPQIGWNIPSEEAIDDAESSEGARPSAGSRPSDASSDTPRDEDRPRDEDLPSVPGFDTSLPSVERRPFPVELVNSLVQSHPLLRVLQGVNIDTGSGGSCVIGSSPFQFDFCQFQWVLNLMGGLIVFIAFLTGLFWAGRSE